MHSHFIEVSFSHQSDEGRAIGCLVSHKISQYRACLRDKDSTRTYSDETVPNKVVRSWFKSHCTWGRAENLLLAAYRATYLVVGRISDIKGPISAIAPQDLPLGRHSLLDNVFHQFYARSYSICENLQID